MYKLAIEKNRLDMSPEKCREWSSSVQNPFEYNSKLIIENMCSPGWPSPVMLRCSQWYLHWQSEEFYQEVWERKTSIFYNGKSYRNNNI